MKLQLTIHSLHLLFLSLFNFKLYKLMEISVLSTNVDTTENDQKCVLKETLKVGYAFKKNALENWVGPTTKANM